MLERIIHASDEKVREVLKNGIIKVDGYQLGSDEIKFYCKSGYIVKMYHDQNCCESVALYDDDGLTNGVDIFTDSNFCDVEIVTTTNREPLPEYDDSYTWTFIKFRTNKGYDTMRWYGCSNGYYSEDVDFDIYITYVFSGEQ